MPNIEVINLTACYEKQVVLDNVSLHIHEGELFFLVGPSGCGKTTLLRLIAGFLAPASGAILFDGKVVTHVPPHRRETAMMFQSYALWPHMSVAENVAFGLEERGLSESQIEVQVQEALRAVCLDGFQKRGIGELSGGQQQRVALARALIVRPRFLLLDEPLSNLDSHLRKGMRDEIRRICKSHQLTAIYVTHDQEEALSMADRIAVMRDGRVLQVGTPEEIYCHPVNRAVAEFMGETNLIQVEMNARRGDSGEVTVTLGDECITLSAPNLNAGQHTRISGFISVRPEAFQKEKPRDAALSISGVVTGVIYQGATVGYHVLTEQGETLKVLEINPSLPLHDVGDALTLWVSVKDLVLLTG